MRTAALFLGLLHGLCGCTTGPLPPESEAHPGVSYEHNLPDYAVFRASHASVRDPNFVPFMAHRIRVGDGRERLVLCHWDPDEFPLAVYIEEPRIDPSLGDEFRPREPIEYVEAVRRAMALWQADLGDQISFREVGEPGDARLTIRLVGEEAPAPEEDVQVLGLARSPGGACHFEGGDPATGRVDVRFSIPELRLYVADRHGLLLPSQVEKVALHELGHALGMRGHSPIPSDLMYEVARDRIARDGLGLADLNSFQALYTMPSGTVYADLESGKRASQLGPPRGEPQLGLAPHVDSRLGFELQTPDGWMSMPTRYGLVAVDGVAWDYRASFQLNVVRFDTVDAYLARFGRAHLGQSALVEESELIVAGRKALRYVLHTPRGSREEFTFLETGDGRVLVAIGEAPAAEFDTYHAWFDKALLSLELREEGRSAPSRSYAPE
ncbi:MAG: matrixin family metalloprotease [bacterium]|nr:matrixin family metalloprotease [bacterium]